MNTEMDTIKGFIERLRSISFFQRLLGWRSVRNDLIDVAAGLNALGSKLDYLQQDKTELINQLSARNKDLELSRNDINKLELGLIRSNELINEKDGRLTQFALELSATKANLETGQKRNNELLTELAELRQHILFLQQELKETKENNLHLLKEEEFRKESNSSAMATLQDIKEQIQQERLREIEERNNVEIARLKSLRDTWNNHQTAVRSSIKSLCNKHAIELIDQVPFKGEPDNVLQICDEYVVFDAKSPGSDDLTNFSSYIKDQAEKAKKYAKQEIVKSDIFFVVPSNTLGTLTQLTYNLGDYNVYVISLDSLEPNVLCLWKIEEYEFAEQMSPEERENICRIIGKFAHLTKRRIQIDSFFAKQFIELVYKSEHSLPQDILEKVAEFERSEKLNPPQEKRTKAINTKELEKDATKMEQDAGARGIVIEDLLMANRINQLPLYKGDS
jgi:hypothetical protein